MVCASSSSPGTAQAKTVYTSANGGITWQNGGAGPPLGLATSVTDAPDGTVVLALVASFPRRGRLTILPNRVEHDEPLMRRIYAAVKLFSSNRIFQLPSYKGGVSVK